MSRSTTVCILTDERIHAVVLNATTIALGETPCVIPDSLLAEHDTDELAEGIARALREAGGSGNPVTLVLPLSWCFTHVLTPTPTRAKASMLAFELEAQLPLPLEELTCAFARLDQDRVLAAAIPTAPMRDLLAVLAQRDVAVDHITLGAVAVMGKDTGAHPTHSTAIFDRRWVTIAAIDGRVGGLTTFDARNMEPTVESITGELATRLAEDGSVPVRWRILDLTSEQSQDADSDGTAEDESGSHYLPIGPAVETIARVAASRPLALDLRTAALAATSRWDSVPRLAQDCLVGALALVVFLTVAMALQTRSTREYTRIVDDARLEVYRDLLGGDRLPRGAAMRLASERIRLEGLTRRHERRDGGTPELSPPPLDTFRDIVDRLPEDVRVMLIDVRLDDSQIHLRGQTAQHRDAERIVEAMNTIPGFNASPPRTSRLASGGVEFSIIAAGGTSDDGT